LEIDMNIRHTALRVALLVSACAVLNACISSTPTWDRTFGNAVTEITALQTMNPNASTNTDPVTGIDGVSATAAQQNYAKSFLTPPPPANMFTIGVSGGSSGGSGN
jgi:hypothetical protein